MTELALYYPVSPHQVMRGWGVRDEYYKDLGFTKHNGVDLALEDNQEVCAPFDATVSLAGNRPKTSGNFLCLLSTNTYRFADGIECRVELTFMHLKEIVVKEGDRVSVGDVIARGGGTGQSFVPHLHISPKRVKRGWFGYRDLDRNDADNTFDPEPYWNGVYAKR